LHEVEVLSEGSTLGVVDEMTVAVNDLQAYPAERLMATATANFITPE